MRRHRRLMVVVHVNHPAEGVELVFKGILVGVSQLESLPSPEKAAIFKHGDGLWMQRPVSSFARPGIIQ